MTSNKCSMPVFFHKELLPRRGMGGQLSGPLARSMQQAWYRQPLRRALSFPLGRSQAMPAFVASQDSLEALV